MLLMSRTNDAGGRACFPLQSFSLIVKVPGLEVDVQTLKIRMLPGRFQKSFEVVSAVC